MAQAVAVEGPGVDRDATPPSIEAISLPVAIANARRSMRRVRVGRSRSPEPFHTAFGGVFYLVNLAIQLEFYGDFTQPAGGIPMCPSDDSSRGSPSARAARRFERMRSGPRWPCLRETSKNCRPWNLTRRSIARLTRCGLSLERLAARALDLPERPRCNSSAPLRRAC
jgi:hypothetical protein